MIEMEDLQIKTIVDIYQEVKKGTIEALYLRGLSLNEIARRLGGSTKPIIKKYIDEYLKLRKEII